MALLNSKRPPGRSGAISGDGRLNNVDGRTVGIVAGRPEEASRSRAVVRDVLLLIVVRVMFSSTVSVMEVDSESESATLFIG